MKKTTCFIFAAILLQVSFTANSTILDFEDLTLGTVYNVGDSFVTSGVTVLATDFVFTSGTPFPGGFSSVENGGLAGGSGNELQVNNINLDFNFGDPIPGLNLLFGEFGGNLNIDINGSFFNFQNFADISGMTIGGVSIAALNGFGDDQGVLSLSGTINSFALGGQELWIDNVSVIPVPAAIWLFGTALIGFIGIARRRKIA